jgi:hypothetical protein
MKPTWFLQDPISRRKGFFEEEVRSLRDFLQVAEQAFERQLDDLKKRFGQLAAQISDPDEGDLAAEPLRDEYWQVQDVFPQIQRKALTAVVLGFMEHQLNELCSALASRDNIQLRVSDLSDRGFVRARKFLIKVIGLDLSGTESTWEELRQIQAVRNVIVHRDGSLKGDDLSKVRAYVDASQHLAADGDALEIKATFVPYALDVSERFALEAFARGVRPNTPVHLKP